MDHTNHVRLNTADYSATLLEGAKVYDVEDHEVGTVSHVHGTGIDSEIVVDVGGFLGIGAKPVAVLATQLDFMRDADGHVHAVTNWTKDELKELPEHHERH